MDNPLHWLVVADGARCSIYSTYAGLERMKLHTELNHPESRMPNHGILSDAMGNRRENNSARHPASGDNRHWERRKKEYTGFAREIATLLNQGLNDGRFDRLVLVCPPEFLGILRAEVSDNVKGRVVAELRKDYSNLDVNELQRALSHQLDLTKSA